VKAKAACRCAHQLSIERSENQKKSTHNWRRNVRTPIKRPCMLPTPSPTYSYLWLSQSYYTRSQRWDATWPSCIADFAPSPVQFGSDNSQFAPPGRATLKHNYASTHTQTKDILYARRVIVISIISIIDVFKVT